MGGARRAAARAHQRGGDVLTSAALRGEALGQALADTLVGARLIAIDAARGLIMALMLIDHVRETFLMHMQVGDPVDPATTPAALFYLRLSSSICAPLFVLLTGLSAWLYGQHRSPAETSRYLLTRGAVLVLLEVTLVHFAWNNLQFPADRLFLQVIWAIGLSMIALGLLIHLPRWAQAGIAAALIAGHNLLDAIAIPQGEPGWLVWALLHDRQWCDISAGLTARRNRDNPDPMSSADLATGQHGAGCL